MKPTTAVFLGAAILFALPYAKKLFSLSAGEVSGSLTGIGKWKLNGGYLEGQLQLSIKNRGDSSFNVKRVWGSVFVNNRPLVDVNVYDAFVVHPQSTVPVTIDLSMPITASAALLVVEAITGALNKSLMLHFDGVVEAEGLSIPIKETVYGNR